MKCWLAAFALFVMATPLHADRVTVRSPGMVQALVSALSSAGATAIATPDPAEPGRYVAAMLFPKVQLLVISAKSSATEYIAAELAAGRHEKVYDALHQAEPATKLFVQDMGGDGLRGMEGGLADLVYERGTTQHILDGNHKTARLSEKDYAALHRRLDDQYARLLSLLVEAAGRADR